MERPRPRPAFCPRSAPRRADGACGDARRLARPRGGQPPARAAVLRRALARAAHSSRARPGRVGARAAPRSGAGGVPGSPGGRASERRPALAHSRRARGSRALRGRRRRRSGERRRGRRQRSSCLRGPRRVARSRGRARAARRSASHRRRPDLAEQILQPVVENACRYGSSRVRVDVARENSSVLFAIVDDGPGVANGEHERIFEPGIRGEARTGVLEPASASRSRAASRAACTAMCTRRRRRLAVAS